VSPLFDTIPQHPDVLVCLGRNWNPAFFLLYNWWPPKCLSLTQN